MIFLITYRLLKLETGIDVPFDNCAGKAETLTLRCCTE